MKIAHMALWTQDLEQQARFWVTFFDGKINEKYCSKTNPGFESYFVRIGDEVAIEIMTKPGLTITPVDGYTLRSPQAARKKLMPSRDSRRNRGF